MDRRRFLSSTVRASALAAAAPLSVAVATAAGDGADHAPFAAPRALAPVDARSDRIVYIGVCTRPFRAAGPRVEAERLGGQTVVHNYGHGGSGWSLSWGSAALAVGMVPNSHDRRLAVIGCGAIGLTSALTAQRAGFRVRIYAADQPPDVRSANATGVWSPDSRVCSADGATPAFERRWEAMARYSFRRYQSLLGLPGEPVEWRDAYVLSDTPFDTPSEEPAGEPEYPELERRLLDDLRPHAFDVPAADHPFPVRHARRFAQMTFNLSAYSRLLVDDFRRAGGEIVTRTFESPRQFRSLPERTIINATGYGARALLGDASIVPVRGQTARLVPQPAVDYCLYYRGHNLAVVPRRDGLLVQAQAEGDFGSADTTPDRAASEAAVARLAALFANARIWSAVRSAG